MQHLNSARRPTALRRCEPLQRLLAFGATHSLLVYRTAGSEDKEAENACPRQVRLRALARWFLVAWMPLLNATDPIDIGHWLPMDVDKFWRCAILRMDPVPR